LPASAGEGGAISASFRWRAFRRQRGFMGSRTRRRPLRGPEEIRVDRLESTCRRRGGHAALAKRRMQAGRRGPNIWRILNRSPAKLTGSKRQALPQC
jgi:hypothetical protein